jgi:hypothetical protein
MVQNPMKNTEKSPRLTRRGPEFFPNHQAVNIAVISSNYPDRIPNARCAVLFSRKSEEFKPMIPEDLDQENRKYRNRCIIEIAKVVQAVR